MPLSVSLAYLVDFGRFRLSVSRFYFSGMLSVSFSRSGFILVSPCLRGSGSVCRSLSVAACPYTLTVSCVAVFVSGCDSVSRAGSAGLFFSLSLCYRFYSQLHIFCWRFRIFCSIFHTSNRSFISVTATCLSLGLFFSVAPTITSSSRHSVFSRLGVLNHLIVLSIAAAVTSFC